MKKTLLTLAAVLVAALVLTACTYQTEKTLDTVETTAAVLQEAKTTETAQANNEVTEPSVATPVEPVNEKVTQKTESAKPDNTANPNANTVDNIVTKEEAKAAALKHAGLKEADVKRLRVELDRERNYLVYEVDFDAGKYEYEYEVNAETGKVVKAEKEFRD